MEHGQVIRDLLLPANQQPPEAIQPGVGSLDDPTPRPITIPMDAFLRLGFRTAGADVGGVALCLHQLPDLRGVRAFVQATVRRLLCGGLGALDDDGLQGGFSPFHIVPIRSLTDDGQGPPFPSVNRLRLVPILRRSVG